MAFVALGLLVLVPERELGVLVVIEALGRLPVARVVAFIAPLTKRAIVLVVFLVARDTSLAELFTSNLVAA